jgi:two-component system LytT family response regulator
MKTLVIDDERLARSEMKRLLAPHDDVEVVAEAGNADEAVDAIEAHDPDLLLLDIQMPGDSGFDLLERLDAVPHVIFVTAYDEYAIRAFEVNALDYLVKPVEPERLADALDKVRERGDDEGPSATVSAQEPQSTLSADDRVFVKDGDRCWFVRLEEVRLFESAGNYTKLYFGDETPLIHRTLSYLEDRLDPDQFFRASRQHILNLQWVDDVEPWFKSKLVAKLEDGQEVEMSRRRSREFRERKSL